MDFVKRVLGLRKNYELKITKTVLKKNQVVEVWREEGPLIVYGNYDNVVWHGERKPDQCKRVKSLGIVPCIYRYNI